MQKSLMRKCMSTRNTRQVLRIICRKNKPRYWSGVLRCTVAVAPTTMRITAGQAVDFLLLFILSKCCLPSDRKAIAQRFMLCPKLLHSTHISLIYYRHVMQEWLIMVNTRFWLIRCRSPCKSILRIKQKGWNPFEVSAFIRSIMPIVNKHLSLRH